MWRRVGAGIPGAGRARRVAQLLSPAAWLNRSRLSRGAAALSAAEAAGLDRDPWRSSGGRDPSCRQPPQAPPRPAVACCSARSRRAPVAGRPRSTATVAREVASGDRRGERVYAIAGPWPAPHGRMSPATRLGSRRGYAGKPFAGAEAMGGSRHPDLRRLRVYRTAALCRRPQRAVGIPWSSEDRGRGRDIPEWGEARLTAPSRRITGREWQAYRRYLVPVDALTTGAARTCSRSGSTRGGRRRIWSVRPHQRRLSGSSRECRVGGPGAHQLGTMRPRPPECPPIGTLGITARSSTPTTYVARRAPRRPEDVWQRRSSPTPRSRWRCGRGRNIPQVVGHDTAHRAEAQWTSADETWDATRRAPQGSVSEPGQPGVRRDRVSAKGMRSGTCKAERSHYVREESPERAYGSGMGSRRRPGGISTGN